MPGILCTHLHENFTRMLPESSYLGNSPVALYGQYDVFHIIIRPTMPLMPGRPTQLRSKLWTATFRAGRCWSMLVVKFFPWFPRFLQFRMDVVHSDRNCSALFLVTYSWTLLRSVFSTEASPKSSVRTSRCCEPMYIDQCAKITNPPAELSAFYTENEPAPGWLWLDLTIRNRQVDGFYLPGSILKWILLGLFYLVQVAGNSQPSTLPSINITWVAPRIMYHELLLVGCRWFLMVPIHRFHRNPHYEASYSTLI